MKKITLIDFPGGALLRGVVTINMSYLVAEKTLKKEKRLTIKIKSLLLWQ
jgi:hypothetical protein